MSKILFLFICFLSFHSFSQESETVTINWLEPKAQSLNAEIVLVPNFEKISFVGFKSYFKVVQKTTQKFNFVISNIVSVEASENDKLYLSRLNIEIPTDFEIAIENKNSGSELFFSILAVPFANINGQVKRLTSFAYTKLPPKPSLNNTQFFNKSYVTNSVLEPGSGQWIKINVSNSGVQKITKAMLVSWGVSPSVNPNHINVFGNGFGKLPEINNVARPDDLLKLDILFQGESDNVLNENDYILFYGLSADKLVRQGLTGFSYDKNIYSDNSCYFINVNENEVPTRISDAVLSSNAATVQVTKNNEVIYHELDLINVLSCGQRFYGEKFDEVLSYSFNFATPGLVATSPVFSRISYVHSGSGTASLIMNVNGNNVNTTNTNNGGGFFTRSSQAFNFNTSGNSLAVSLNYVRSNAAMLAYLDRFEFNYVSQLNFRSPQLAIRNLSSVGPGNVGNYVLGNMSANSIIWETTVPNKPAKVNFSFSGNQAEFKIASDQYRSFIAFDGTGFETPSLIGNVSYQNLHGLSFADYLIVTNPRFSQQAERLANLHRLNTGLTVHVVTTDQIYNEFSSGMQDVTAIKQFVKMFYDRAKLSGNNGNLPKYLCLFGDGTFDPKNRVNNNNNLIPTFQMTSPGSEDLFLNILTDDYFGLLDDNESIAESDLVDVGIGRLIVSDATQATQMVDKIEHYMKNGSDLFAGQASDCNESGKTSTFGDWRLRHGLIADDSDGEIDSLFVKYQESNDLDVDIVNPTMIADKCYLDAFQQTSGSGGQRYDEAVNWINREITRGNSMLSYVGHGSELSLASERIITYVTVQEYKNINRLFFGLTATCEFTRFDDAARVSAGEYLWLNPLGGAINLLTTTRPLTFTAADLVSNAVYTHSFAKDSSLLPLRFGDISRRARNEESARAVCLLGDPALRICLPIHNIIVDSVNNFPTITYVDTLRALAFATASGHLETQAGAFMNTFNGEASITILDKALSRKTLGQDDNASPMNFKTQTSALFRGKVSVKNGLWKCQFIVPKDISFNYGFGKIVGYANNETTDASGSTKKLVIGGIDPNGILDSKPPELAVFLNNESFVDGGLTSQNPIVLIKLKDESGINAVGSGVGNDITAVLDGDLSKPIVLNDLYESDLDTYKSGKVNYPLVNIKPGLHTLRVKASDVNNNFVIETINFEVREDKEMVLSHVLNYPNPFTSSTEFYFEHNQSCVAFDAQIQVFTVNGKLVKTINETVNSSGFRSAGIPWDGKDDYGDFLAKGVYIYKLRVKTCTGKTAEKIEKLVLLR